MRSLRCSFPLAHENKAEPQLRPRPQFLFSLLAHVSSRSPTATPHLILEGSDMKNWNTHGPQRCILDFTELTSASSLPFCGRTPNSSTLPSRSNKQDEVQRRQWRRRALIMGINGVIGCDMQEVRTSTCSLFECVLTFFLLERLLSFNAESLPVTITCNERHHLQTHRAYLGPEYRRLVLHNDGDYDSGPVS